MQTYEVGVPLAPFGVRQMVWYKMCTSITVTDSTHHCVTNFSIQESCRIEFTKIKFKIAVNLYETRPKEWTGRFNLSVLFVTDLYHQEYNEHEYLHNPGI